MAILWRWVLVWIMLCTAGPRLLAASAETHDFTVAKELFAAAIYTNAEAELAAFTQKFPASAHLPEAILLQAEARIRLTNYAGAIELLAANHGAAGALADQYLFWLAEAYSRKGEYQTTGDLFAKLVKDYPASALCVEARVREATARAKLSDWARVLELETNGVFQAAAHANPTNGWVVRGWLLVSEARLAQTNYSAAEAVLQPLAKLALNPELDGQRQYLLCQILEADQRTEQALQNSTNLLALAAATGQRQLQADSAALQARIFERRGRLDAAIAAYTNNLAEGCPVKRQTEALSKVTELYLAQNRIADAAQTLEAFLSRCPGAPAADLARLTVGELRLRQHMAGACTNAPSRATTNAPATTNCLGLALEALQTFTTNSPLYGKAQLDLGWCYWEQGKTPGIDDSNKVAALKESEAAFQTAVERLPLSADQARAYFKLADVQFERTNFSGAIANYSAIIEKFEAVPEVRTNLFEPALYQKLKACLKAGKLDVATNVLARILDDYPNGFHTDGAVLLVGQEQNPAMAQKLFKDFIRKAPQAPLVPEIELAIAHTYERDNKWPEVVARDEGWLAIYTNHPARTNVEYYLANAYFMAGRDTNALTCFTNFIARYPTNKFTPLALMWLADYNFRLGGAHLVEAEEIYQRIYKDLPPSEELGYKVRMMAGRVAAARQSWDDARNYFLGVAYSTNCPDNLRAQALYAAGDCWINRDFSTNKPADYRAAMNAFEEIRQKWPTNKMAVLALGGTANCLLQLAAQGSGDYESVSNAWQQVVDSPLADATARSMAKVGLGVALEKMAEQKPAERAALRGLALTNYLDVFDRKFLRDGEEPDLFWTKKATLEAARVAEGFQRWEQAIGLYQRLKDLIPTLAPWCEERIQKCKGQEKLAREKQVTG
jgi:TolA-binding protein